VDWEIAGKEGILFTSTVVNDNIITLVVPTGAKAEYNS